MRVSLGGARARSFEESCQNGLMQNVSEAVSWCLSSQSCKSLLINQALSLELASPPTAWEFIW